MIQTIVQTIFNIVWFICSLFMRPIDLVINAILPSLSDLLTYIGSFFAYIANIVPFAVSWLGLSTEMLNLIVLYYTTKLTLPILLWTIKTGLEWFNRLKIK